MKSPILILTVLASIALVGCARQVETDENFRNIGFTEDGRCFQTVVTIEPDETARGLVEKRESALKNLALHIQERVIRQITDYCLEQIVRRPGEKPDYKSISEDPAVKKYFTKKLKRYASSGSIALQYFDENDSVVAVYRIKRKLLRGTINALTQEFTSKRSIKENSP